MISTSHLEDEDKDETEEMIQRHRTWIKHLNILWDIRFE